MFSKSFQNKRVSKALAPGPPGGGRSGHTFHVDAAGNVGCLNGNTSGEFTRRDQVTLVPVTYASLVFFTRFLTMSSREKRSDM
jgi:hypothetical protein